MDLATKLAKTCLQVKKASAESGASIVPEESTGLPQVTPESMRDTFERSLQEEKILRNSADRYMQLANRRAMDNDQGPGGAFFSRLLPVPWSAGEAAWRLPLIAATGYAGHQVGTDIAKRFGGADPAFVSKALLPTDTESSPLAKALAKRIKAKGLVDVAYPERHLLDIFATPSGKSSPLVEAILNADPVAAQPAPEVMKEIEAGKAIQNDIDVASQKVMEQHLIRAEALKELRKQHETMSRPVETPVHPVAPTDFDAVGSNLPFPGPSAQQPIAQLTDEQLVDFYKRAPTPNKFISKPLSEIANAESAIRQNTVDIQQKMQALEAFNAKYSEPLAQLAYRQRTHGELNQLLSAYAEQARNDPAEFSKTLQNFSGIPDKTPAMIGSTPEARAARAARQSGLLFKEMRNALGPKLEKSPARLDEMGQAGRALHEILKGLQTEDRSDVSALLNTKNINLTDKQKVMRNKLNLLLEAGGLEKDTLEKAYTWLIENEGNGWKPKSKWGPGLGVAGGIMLGGALTGLPMAIRAARLNRTGGELAQKARLRSRKAIEQADKEQFRRENILRALEGRDVLPRSELRDNIRTKRKAWHEAMRNSHQVARMAGGDSSRLLEAFRNAGAEKQGALDTIRRILD